MVQQQCSNTCAKCPSSWISLALGNLIAWVVCSAKPPVAGISNSAGIVMDFSLVHAGLNLSTTCIFFLLFILHHLHLPKSQEHQFVLVRCTSLTATRREATRREGVGFQVPQVPQVLHLLQFFIMLLGFRLPQKSSDIIMSHLFGVIYGHVCHHPDSPSPIPSSIHPLTCIVWQYNFTVQQTNYTTVSPSTFAFHPQD